MNRKNRREFLGDVSRGMIIASVGTALASDLGFSPAFAGQGEDTLSFGDMEPLVAAMQETPLERFQPLMVEKLRRGEANLRQLTTAAALANARTFGGEDYVGFHCMMALVPAFEMSAELPEAQRPLPILKVLYRNTSRIQGVGGRAREVLRPVPFAELPAGANGGQLLRQATQQRNTQQAEGILGNLSQRSAEEAFNALQYIIQDKADVHRVALAHRSWEMVDLLGQEHAHTLLRQSVHYCVRNNPDSNLNRVLTNLLDQHQLIGRELGNRQMDDEWVANMSRTVFQSGRDQAAGAVAAALAEGISPEAIGEAISLAANEIILRQTQNRTHGDSRGVHASDAVNAWRNISRVTNDRNKIVSLIVAAYHVARAGQRVITGRGAGSPLSNDQDPLALIREEATGNNPQQLLGQAEEAIRSNEQIAAAAAIFRYSQLQTNPRPVFDLLLNYAISEDGRLHAEKFYRTVTEEFASIRPAFRWRQLFALARVTASAYGFTRQDQSGHRAPGYLQARELLGLT